MTSTRSFSVEISYRLASSSSTQALQSSSTAVSRPKSSSRSTLSRPNSLTAKKRLRVSVPAIDLASEQLLSPASASATASRPISPRSASYGTPCESRRPPRALRHVKSTSHFDNRKHVSRLAVLPQSSQGGWRRGSLRLHIVDSPVEAVDLSVIDEHGGFVTQLVTPLSAIEEGQLEVQPLHPSMTQGVHALSMATKTGPEIIVAFDDTSTRVQWHCLLRAIWPVSTARARRQLSLEILDIHRADSLVTEPDFGPRYEASSGHYTVTSTATRSTVTRANKSKTAWSSSDWLAAELHLDDEIVARTAWVRSENGLPPFWGSAFFLDRVKDFRRSTLRIYRKRRGDPELFAHVSLPLVSSYTTRRDERFPVFSEGGGIIGEIRLNVNLYEASAFSEAEQTVLSLLRGKRGLQCFEELHTSGLLKEFGPHVARIGIAEGYLFARLGELAFSEASHSPEVLFRGNTPLSKLLECTMRLCCHDFLISSLGPTIMELEKHSNQPSEHLLLSAADQCWQNISKSRHLFPGPIRAVLSDLRSHVVKQGLEVVSLGLRAVASFVFLRLIGPALLQPQQYGLTETLPVSGARVGLTFIAKLLHNTAFVVDEFRTLEGLSSRAGAFIERNRPAVVDFLSYIASPAERPPMPTAIDVFIASRLESMSPQQRSLMPIPTIAGAVTTASDAAHLASMLQQRTKPWETDGLKSQGVGLQQVFGQILEWSEDSSDLDEAHPRIGEFRALRIDTSTVSVEPSPTSASIPWRTKIATPISAWFNRSRT